MAKRGVPDWFDREEPSRTPAESLRFRARNGKADEAKAIGSHCLARALVKPPMDAGRPQPLSRDHVTLGSARRMENGNLEQLMACSRCLILCAVEMNSHYRAVGITETPEELPFYGYRGTVDDCPIGRLRTVQTEQSE